MPLSRRDNAKTHANPKRSDAADIADRAEYWRKWGSAGFTLPCYAAFFGVRRKIPADR